MRQTPYRLVAVAILVATLPACGMEKLQVMILDGESAGPYHDWPRVTAALEQILDETGLFDVSIVTAPGPDGDFAAFHPDFAAFDVVVLNYDAPDERWPASLESSFETYVRNGGGMVSVHAADNAFPGWAAYNEMIGVGGWRNRTADAGPYWYYERDELVADPSTGSAGSHGRREQFVVDVRDGSHPIMQGLPASWMHGADELYAHLRGPGKNMTVLATAYSDPANAGSGRHEPQLMALSYGAGRIFHTTFGHDLKAISSADFAVTLQRGTEWAATNHVTQSVPPDFPTADAPRYRTTVAGATQSSANATPTTARTAPAAPAR